MQSSGGAAGQRVAALAVSVSGEDCTKFCMDLPVKKTIVILFNVNNRLKDNNNFSGDILGYPLSPGKGAVQFFYVSHQFPFTSNSSRRLCFP